MSKPPVNTITVDISFESWFGGVPSWSAYAIINGHSTSVTCMHSHTRPDLAQTCADKYFVKMIKSMTDATLVDIGDGLHEARWTNTDGRPVARRYRYTLNNQHN